MAPILVLMAVSKALQSSSVGDLNTFGGVILFAGLRLDLWNIEFKTFTPWFMIVLYALTEAV